MRKLFNTIYFIRLIKYRRTKCNLNGWYNMYITGKTLICYNPNIESFFIPSMFEKSFKQIKFRMCTGLQCVAKFMR